MRVNSVAYNVLDGAAGHGFIKIVISSEGVLLTGLGLSGIKLRTSGSEGKKKKHWYSVRLYDTITPTLA